MSIRSGPASSRATPAARCWRRTGPSTGWSSRRSGTPGTLAWPSRPARSGPPSGPRPCARPRSPPSPGTARRPDPPVAPGGGAVSAPGEGGRALFGKGALALTVVVGPEAGLDHRLDPGQVAPVGGPPRLADRRLGRGDGEGRVLGDVPGQAHHLFPQARGRDDAVDQAHPEGLRRREPPGGEQDLRRPGRPD